jgi:hypothetical protein
MQRIAPSRVPQHFIPASALCSIVALTLCAAPAVVRAVPIQAIAAPPRPIANLVNAIAAIPANGALLIEWVGNNQGLTADAVTMIVTDAAGQTVPGTLRMLERYWFWTPTQPFTPGATYSVQVMAGTVGTSNVTPISILSARASLRPPLVNMLTAQRTDTTLEQQCCTALAGFPYHSSGCFPTKTQGSILMTANLSSPASASELGQFVFRTGPAGMRSGAWQYGISPRSIVFSEQAAQYCFQVEALELATGIIFKYDDLNPHCLALNGIDDLAPKAAPIDAKTVLDRTICQVPPMGLEAMWCKTNESICASDAALPGCEDYGHLCRAEPAPVPPAAGSGGAAGSVQVVARAGTGGVAAGSAGTSAAAGTSGIRLPDHGDAGSTVAGMSAHDLGGSAPTALPTEPPAKHVTAGCSALAPHAGHGTAMNGVLVLLLGTLRARRRLLRRTRA